tara:strand:+ start:332 stop:499 length:168 start_codon:yes stop_codon:yes gene_type:complete
MTRAIIFAAIFTVMLLARERLENSLAVLGAFAERRASETRPVIITRPAGTLGIRG